MAASGPARWCPLCQRGELQRHCPSTNRVCLWERCPKCRVVFDPVESRGYDHTGDRITWPGHWPPGAAA